MAEAGGIPEKVFLAALGPDHLTTARRILAQFGQTPILARVETALAELGQ